MSQKLSVVPMSDLKPGDEFYLIDGDAWTFEGKTEYADVANVSSFPKGIKSAQMWRADARLVVVVNNARR